MSKNLNMWDLSEKFWKEQERAPFSNNAGMLYMFLIREAGRNFWKGPLILSWNYLQNVLGCSRDTLSRAISDLTSRQMIDYKKGKSHSRSSFWFCEIQSDLQLENQTINQTEDQTEVQTEAQEKERTKEKEKNKTIEKPYSSIIQAFNQICKSYPPVKAITKPMVKRIDEILKTEGIESFQLVFEKIESSEFLKGYNRFGWKATFDWLIRNHENFLKVLEGRYDDNGSVADNAIIDAIKGPSFDQGPDLSSIEI